MNAGEFCQEVKKGAHMSSTVQKRLGMLIVKIRDSNSGNREHKLGRMYEDVIQNIECPRAQYIAVKNMIYSGWPKMLPVRTASDSYF